MARLKESFKIKINTVDEDTELARFIEIYKICNLKEVHEVCNYITKNKLWNKFSNIRSLNDHSGNKEIPGILPKFFTQVCKKLDIKGAGGLPLDKAVHY